MMKFFVVGPGAENGKGCQDRIKIEKIQEFIEEGTDSDLGN